MLTRALSRRGFAVDGATNVKNALELALRKPPACVVLDLNLSGSSGLALIEPLLAINAECRIVVSVSYTHLDVYKRQDEVGDLRHRPRGGFSVSASHEVVASKRTTTRIEPCPDAKQVC